MLAPAYIVAPYTSGGRPLQLLWDCFIRRSTFPSDLCLEKLAKEKSHGKGRSGRWQARAFNRTTFPAAPIRSRTVGFPESGSDTGFLSLYKPSLCIPGLNADTHVHPLIHKFTYMLVLCQSFNRLCVLFIL